MSFNPRFTFGIITDGSQPNRVNRMIKSINKQEIPEHEIIIVGGQEDGEWTDNVVHVPFDETIKPAWITRKKNLIAKLARFNNIVYMHDYIILTDEWYRGFQEFTDQFHVCMTPIINANGGRFRDWVTWGDHDYDAFSKQDSPGMVLPPYHYKKTERMYISGSYWVVKRGYMRLHPLNERLSWGEGEDVEWSLQLRPFWDYKMNTKSPVQLLKWKDPVFPEVSHLYE